MKRVVLSIALLGASMMAGAQSLPTRELLVGLFKIQAEVAATEEARETGLMNRKSMPSQAGMLFVFESSAVHCFWMKNTLIPLSIAFLDAQGKVVSVDEMQALSERAHCPPKPVRYALEMNKGWFRAKGIGAGAQIDGIGASAAKP